MTPPPDDPVTALGVLVQADIDRRAESPLAALDGPSRELDDALLAWLPTRREAIAAWLAATLHGEPGEPRWATHPDAWLRAQLVRWLRRRNQFIELDAAAIAGLDALCRQGLIAAAAVLASRDELRPALRSCLLRSRAALASFVRTHLGAEPRDVVSSEYSPGLQLELLGLDITGLPAPVLDVGCGAHAKLVLALRAEGIAAEGIDRDADPMLATIADWRTYPYGVDRWGTVVSHLGFSLHLLHHHLAGRPTAFAYAEVYMQILRSLRVDGVFAYAPGLPFLERLLPRERYRCTRTAAPQSRSLQTAAADTGLVLGHATQVRRLA